MEFPHYLSQPPSVRLEFLEIDKRGQNSFLFPIICSFLNAEGGIIIIGLSREKESQNLTEIEIDNFIKLVHEGTLHNKALLNPSRGLQTDKINYEGNNYAIVKVIQSPDVHKSGDRYYKRIGDLTKWVIDPHEIEALFLTRRPSTESTIVENVLTSDLDLNLLNRVRSIVNLRDSNHRWLSMNDDEIIMEAQLAVEDKTKNRIMYSLAAVLLLGKEGTIRRTLPGYMLDIFIRKDNIDRWDDRKTLRKNLIDTRIEALEFIKSHLPEPFFSEGDQRKDLRDLIFREIVSNVIIHREYTDVAPTEIIVFKDSFQATNPNKIFKSGPINPGDFRNHPKNPFIRSFFNELGWSDEAGSGVRNVSRYLREYVKGAIPIFIEDNPFYTQIPLKTYIIGDYSTLVLKLFDIKPETFDEKLHSYFKEISLNPQLDNDKNDNEFINGFIGALIKNNRSLVKAKVLKDSMVISIKEKTIGATTEINRSLLTSKGKKLIKVLIGLLMEMSIEEVRVYIESASTDSVWLNYLRVLKEDELINLTFPDSKFISGQKYIITDKGKKLLGGFEI